jgi:hypothetical protein
MDDGFVCKESRGEPAVAASLSSTRLDIVRSERGSSMVDFDPGFDITPRGVSFIARVDGHLVGCWIDASALAEKGGW